MTDEPAGTQTPSEVALERALEHALARVLKSPPLPMGLRANVRAALLRESQGEGDAQARARLEHREQLSAIKDDYVRLRTRTLGTLIGGAFATGAAIALAFPWLKATFGPNAILAVAVIGAVAGLVISSSYWLGRVDWAGLVRRG